MSVALLFPPATDPRGPHLSLASLAAHLRGNDIDVDLHDLDIEALEWVLEPERLAAAAERAEACVRTLPPAQQDAMAHLVGLAPWLVENASLALDSLRRLDEFLDPDRHHEARRTITAALRLVSGSTAGRVTYAISGAAYDVVDVDPGRLVDLLAVTADPTANLFHDLYADSVLPALAAAAPSFVGISILNRQQVIPGLFLARLCKDAGHTVVLGGTVYAKFHEALCNRPAFFEAFCHALVPYEGETALLGLARAIDGGAGPHDLAGIPNVLSLDHDGRVVAGPTHVEDVRSLPTPDFTGMPLDRYLNPVPVLPIVTGKGCYFNRCKFCDIPYINTISAKPYRVRDAEQIALDVATLHERHGARHFEITDETLSPKLLVKLADALDAYPDLAPRFVGYARFEPGFTPEACRRIHEMGMRKLFFGLESGNQAMLDHMDKGIDVDVARQVLRNCVDAGIAVHVFSIVGFPEETEDQARDTLAFLLDEHPTLDAPMNTFDVHPFGLDLRTEYGDNPETFGVEVDRSQLDGIDFPITLKGWRNTRGIDQELAGKLLDEFTAELRSRYHGWRAYPEQQWAGFEEYAVVYGDHYGTTPGGLPFPFRLTLPDTGDVSRWSLRWATHVQVAPHPEEPDRLVILRTLAGDTPVPAAVVTLVGMAPEAVTADELLDGMVAALGAEGPAEADQTRAHLRQALDGLLALRALWLRPAADPGDAPSDRVLVANAAPAADRGVPAAAPSA